MDSFMHTILEALLGLARVQLVMRCLLEGASKSSCKSWVPGSSTTMLKSLQGHDGGRRRVLECEHRRSAEDELSPSSSPSHPHFALALTSLSPSPSPTPTPSPPSDPTPALTPGM